ncbi:MAG: hypothetical protein AB2A00_10180 [Myxococcota bacterium]
MTRLNPIHFAFLLALGCTTPSPSSEDAALPDAASRADAGRPDAARADAALPDAALPDATSSDAARPDANRLDASVTDASIPTADAARPDATVPLDANIPTDATSPADAAAEVDAAVTPDAGGYGPAGTPFPIAGFGAATRGGWQDGHDTVVVTSLDDDGTGTLREALRTNGAPRVITFAVDGVIALVTALIVPSNVTVDGRGHDITLRGKGFVLPGSDEVILINLAISDVAPDSEDGVQIGSALPDPSENVVLDHLAFLQSGEGGDSRYVDEAISVVFGSRNITVAWCRFERWEKVMLFGNGDADPALDALQTITVHHSYALQTGRRHPQARHGHFHLFNNFWDDWRMYGPFFTEPYYESFGSQCQDNGRMLLEGQMVRRHPHEFESFTQANHASRCESGGDILETGTWMDPASTAPLEFGVGCAGVEAFVPPYSVVVEEAGAPLRDRVVTNSGNTLR